MKKKIIILSIIILIIIGTSVLIFTKYFNKKNSYIEEINVAKLEEKLKNKDSFVLVITQTNCSHCINYRPILETVGKEYDITFYDINLTNLKNDEFAKLSSIANSSGTPTTIFYEKGEEKTTLNRLIGETSETKLVTKLKKLKYIKE